MSTPPDKVEGVIPEEEPQAQLLRHYLQPSADDPSRQRRILRQGEVVAERTPGEGDEALLDFEHGAGIVVDATGDGARWIADVTCFGYLETNGQDVPSIRSPVSITEDRMRAYVELRSPGADEQGLAVEEIGAALTAAGVVHGVRPAEIERALEMLNLRGSLPRPICLARGDAYEAGRPAHLELAIGAELTAGTVGRGEGQIDFRERSSVKNVCAGQLIATWSPATPGTPGCRVDGTPLPTEKVESRPVKAGKNVAVHEQEDGSLTYEAEIDGMLDVGNGSELSVVDVLQIDGDVDYGTGNLNATGAIVIRGSIRSTFRVASEKDVIVHGSIEDARVEAGGAIEVQQGIVGGEFGFVTAESTLQCTHAQNAKIRAGGDVTIGRMDIGSEIRSGGRILATAANGILRGGRYSALNGLEARELGSEYGVPTWIQVGPGPEVVAELRRVQGELRKLAEEQHQALQEGSEAQRLKLEKQERELRVWEIELNELLASTPPVIKVESVIHAGVELHSAGAHLKTDHHINHVRFRFDSDEGEIKAEPL